MVGLWVSGPAGVGWPFRRCGRTGDRVSAKSQVEDIFALAPVKVNGQIKGNRGRNQHSNAVVAAGAQDCAKKRLKVPKA